MILRVLRHRLKHKARPKRSLYLQTSLAPQQSLHIKAELQQQRAAAQSLAAEQMTRAARSVSDALSRKVEVPPASRRFVYRNSSSLIMRSNRVSLIYSTPAGHRGQVGQNLFQARAG